MGRKGRLVVRVRPLPLRSEKQYFADHQFQGSFGPESAISGTLLATFCIFEFGKVELFSTVWSGLAG